MIACCTRKFWRYSPMFPRDPCALHRCNSLPPINPYGKLHTLVVHNFTSNCSCYYKIPWNTSDIPRILFKLLLCKYLSACMMVTSICLAILISILCHRHFEHLIRYICECSQSSVLITILPLAHMSLRTWSGVRQIKPCLIVDLCLSYLLVFEHSLYLWFPDLETVIPLLLSLN